MSGPQLADRAIYALPPISDRDEDSPKPLVDELGEAAELYSQRSEHVEENFRRVTSELAVGLGQAHPRTLTAMHNTADALCRQGLVQDAETLYTQVSELSTRTCYPSSLES